jgi:hypothetical protein
VSGSAATHRFVVEEVVRGECPIHGNAGARSTRSRRLHVVQGRRRTSRPSTPTWTASAKNDHKQILSCLTDYIEWTVFGAFHLTGKEAYDKAIDGAPEFIDPREFEVVRCCTRALR